MIAEIGTAAGTVPAEYSRIPIAFEVRSILEDTGLVRRSAQTTSQASTAGASCRLECSATGVATAGSSHAATSANFSPGRNPR